MSKVEIEIRTYPTFKPKRLIISAAIQVGVIGLGIWADSAAMQWLGFTGVCITGLVIATVEINKGRGLTIREARRLLDELEAKEGGAE